MMEKLFAIPPVAVSLSIAIAGNVNTIERPKSNPGKTKSRMPMVTPTPIKSEAMKLSPNWEKPSKTSVALPSSPRRRFSTSLMKPTVTGPESRPRLTIEVAIVTSPAST